jgi:hypothetical protein
MTPFVEKTIEDKRAALKAMSDADLLAPWHREDLNPLTTAERDRLIKYRHDTLDFYDYCDTPSIPKATEAIAEVHAVLDRWCESYTGLRDWNSTTNAARAADDLNPVTKVVQSECSFIGTFRCQLPSGGNDD